MRKRFERDDLVKMLRYELSLESEEYYLELRGPKSQLSSSSINSCSYLLSGKVSNGT